ATIAWRAAVNSRPAIKSGMSAPKDVIEAFASGRVEKASDIWDTFRPKVFKPVDKADTVQMMFVTMAVNRNALTNLTFADASAVSAMLIMGLSSGLMAKEQFKVDSSPILPDHCDKIVEQWMLYLLESSTVEYNEEEKKKMKEYMASVLEDGIEQQTICCFVFGGWTDQWKRCEVLLNSYHIEIFQQSVANDLVELQQCTDLLPEATWMGSRGNDEVREMSAGVRDCPRLLGRFSWDASRPSCVALERLPSAMADPAAEEEVKKRPKTPKKKQPKDSYGTPTLDPPWQSTTSPALPAAPMEPQGPTAERTLLQELVHALEHSDTTVSDEVQTVIDKTKKAPEPPPPSASAKSVRQESNFLNEWRASIHGLDLAFEVSQMRGFGFAETPLPSCPAVKNAGNLCVRFDDTVELYVGHEQDWHLQFWQHNIGVPILHADIFQPLTSPLSDEISFMATPGHHRLQDFGPHEHVPPNIMQNPDIGIDPAEAPAGEDNLPALSDDEMSVLNLSWDTDMETSALARHFKLTMLVAVWFVDHHNGRLHCPEYRSVQLGDDYTQWELQLARPWQELRIDSLELEFHLVLPHPEVTNPEIEAHIILVQAPHQQLVTNLLTVFEEHAERQQVRLQNAVAHTHGPREYEADVQADIDAPSAVTILDLQHTGEQSHDAQIKKHYIDEEAWNTRKIKLKHRATLKALRTRIACDILRRCFGAWNMRCKSMPGTGSDVDRSREEAHDFLLPPLKGEGPQLPPAHPREEICIDDALHLHLVEAVDARMTFSQLEASLGEYVATHPISWSMWRATLRFFVDMFEEEDADFFQYDIAEFKAFFEQFLRTTAWPFLQYQRRHDEVQQQRTIAACHDQCSWFLEHTGSRAPRVIRDCEHLWGYESVGLTELQQLLVGNTLLGFSMEAMTEIAGVEGMGILEHPAEPDDLPSAASIWRLPLMQWMLGLPGATRLRFSQGLMGAPSPKPTDLLLINMDHLLLHLHRCRV
ncbi:unnamed protein product, partial [Cladocopium goreaui]